MRPLLILAAISGFSAVLIGAMGSHFLSPHMTEKGPELFRTANLYHLIHSLTLLGAALLFPIAQKSAKAVKFLKLSAALFVTGLLLFSGLIYYVALFPGFPFHFLIPLGGLSYMLGWLMLGVTALSLKAE